MLGRRIVPAVLVVGLGFLAGGIDASGAWATTAVPPKPFIESVSPEGLGGLVAWAPDPVSAQVTGYSVQVVPAPGITAPAGCAGPFAATATSSDTAALVSGLCVGVAYVAQVQADNTSGPSSWSARSNPFAALPAEAPASPLITGVVGRDGGLVVSWSPPQLNGGAAITGYIATATANGSPVSVSVDSSTTSTVISGLADGTSYQVSVVAENSIGPSAAATSSGTPAAPYAPSAPTDFTAVPAAAGSGEIDLSWSPPVDDGGSAITSYAVTYEQMTMDSSGNWVPAPGASPTTVPASASAGSLAVTGLTPSDGFWSFSIVATNSAGSGAAASVPAPVSPQPTGATGTVVLTPSTMASLSADKGTVLVWPAPAPAQVTALKKGQVLVAAPVAAAPDGLLDVVTNVSTTSSGGYNVAIKQAALSDAFTNLTLASSGDPVAGSPYSGGATFHPAMPGVRLLRQRAGAPRAGVTFTRDMSIGIDFGTGPFKVSGELDLTPTIGVQVGITHGIFGIPDGGSITASATITAKASIAATLEGSETQKIGEIDGAPQDFQAGPIPVVVVPKIPVYLTVSGKIGTEVTASITIGGSVTWSSKNPGALTVKNLSTPPSISGNPLESISGSASFGLEEQPQLDIYDATGPNLEADENLQATVNPTPSAGQNYFSLTPSIALKTGWDVDLLGTHASLEATIANLSFAPFVIAPAPGAFLSLSPPNASVPAGGKLAVTASRSDGQTDPITWSLIGSAGDTITSAGVLHAASAAGRTLTVLAKDSTGASGVDYVTVGQPFDPPGGLHVASSVTGKTGTVSWQAPARTGGAPIASYTVTTNPATSTTTVPAGTTSVTVKVTPTASYVISVYATNSQGLRSDPATVIFTPGSGAKAVSAGGNDACAVLISNTISCWGYNVHGQLGNGTTTDSATPVAVSGISNATAVSAAGEHVCAIVSGGSVDCWGWNIDGQLGNGTTTDSSTPVPVVGITNAVALATTSYDSCAVLATGAVSCWGYDRYEQLGSASAGVCNDGACSTTPVQVPGITNAVSVAIGGTLNDGSACALLATGSVTCWGSDDYGQVGDGSFGTQSPPTPVTGITNAVQITGTFYTMCARLSTGTLDCWGFGNNGELGNGTDTSSATPVQVSGILNATAVSAGTGICALLADNTAECWGSPSHGELGDGTYTAPDTCGQYAFPCARTPVAVSGPLSAASLSVGDGNVCVVLANAGVDCWGDDAYGQLGDGASNTDRALPGPVLGIP